MKASIFPSSNSHVILHCEQGDDRSRMVELLAGLGARSSHLGEIDDLDAILVHDPIDLALVEAGGLPDPLERMLAALERVGTGEGEEPPIIVMAPSGILAELAERTQGRPHAVFLAQPFNIEELTSALRSALAIRDRQHATRDLLDQLRAANLELDRRRREAEAESRRRTQFLAAISHELRTPIQEISFVGQVVEAAVAMPDMPVDWVRLSDGLLDGVGTLRDLVDDLTDIARLDLGTQDVCELVFPLAAYLETILTPYRKRAVTQNLSLIVSVEPPTLHLRTDPDRLAQLVKNLVSNAVKFTPQGEVMVRAIGDEVGLMLEVRDTGRGIAPDSISTIFDEFSQLHNPERGRAKGTGLGLAICRRVVQVLNGTIEVESQPGQGSRFTVRLPSTLIEPPTPEDLKP